MRVLTGMTACLRIVLGLSLAGLVPGSLAAAPITYVFTGTAGGALGGQPYFGNFTLEVRADTDNVYELTDPDLQYRLDVLPLNGDSALITIDGLGTATILSFTRIQLLPVRNANCKCVLFGSFTGPMFAFAQVEGSDSYDLRGDFGPVTYGISGVGYPGISVLTDRGVLNMSQGAGGSSFSASLVPVPVSGAAWMFGAALGLLAPLVRRGAGVSPA